MVQFRTIFCLQAFSELYGTFNMFHIKLVSRLHLGGEKCCEAIADLEEPCRVFKARGALLLPSSALLPWIFFVVSHPDTSWHQSCLAAES